MFGNHVPSNEYAIDIVLCVDATGGSGMLLEKLREMAPDFGTHITECYAERNRVVKNLRIKVITFRDFDADVDALVSSPFFSLPDDNDRFIAYINELRAHGGGDEPENSLEALAEAMNSEWTQEEIRRRHIIFLFTDAGGKAFEDSNDQHEQYPDPVPKSLLELEEWWEHGTPNGALDWRVRRLVLFAPDRKPWNMIANWNLTWFMPVIPGYSCSEVTTENICQILTGIC